MATGFCQAERILSHSYASSRKALPGLILPKSGRKGLALHTLSCSPFEKATRCSSGGVTQRPHALCQAGLRDLPPVTAVRQELQLASNQLNADVRDKVQRAVERQGFRVAVGDVAAMAGVTLRQAEDALKALACDTAAGLEVSKEGDVVYAFKPDFVSVLRSKSLSMRVRPWVQRASGALSLVARISFGAALFASIAIVWAAVVVLLSSRSDDRNDRRGGYYGRGPGLNIWINLTDLLYLLDPYYYRTAAQRRAAGQEMSFLEAVFSFVFGDGDPNFDFQERRWTALGMAIRAKGGAMTAEEMAPFLDPPMPRATGDGPMYDDESFVLPSLVRFNGEPVVDEAGRLVYVFPSLQKSGQEAAPVTPSSVPLEEEVLLTAASPGQTMLAAALGLFNITGVIVLGSLLADPMNRAILAYQGLGFVGGLLPALQLYAATFFAVPAIRWLRNQPLNQQIESRNTARIAAADLLSSPKRWLMDKVRAARRLAQRKILRRQDAIFATDAEEASGGRASAGVTGQIAARELDDWDAVFEKTKDSSVRPRR